MDINSAIKKCFEYCLLEPNNNLEESVFNKYMESIPADFIYHYPSSVTWKITNNCNLRCKHCFYASKPESYSSNNNLSKNETLDLAKYLVEELNIMTVLITGGEPLLSDYFFDLIKYFKSKNVCISIITNGTLIDKKTASKIVNYLNPKYDGIQISIESAEREIHDSIRGIGSFDKTINAIEYFTDNNFYITIATTLTSKNIDSLDSFINFARKYKIKMLRLGRYKVFSKEQEYLAPDLDKLFANIATLIENNIPIPKNIFNAYDFLKYDYGKKLMDTLSEPLDYSCNKLCHNHNKVFIAPNGNLYLCTSSETADLSLGNLREDSFEEIWDKRFLNPLFKERIDFICKDCKYKYWCNSGCPTMAYLENKTICSATSECKYQKLLEKNNA